jgi:hypothetical protein
MSKYKKDEIQQIWKEHSEQMNLNHAEQSEEVEDQADAGESVPNMHSINAILDISIEQNDKLIKE